MPEKAYNQVEPCNTVLPATRFYTHPSQILCQHQAGAAAEIAAASENFSNSSREVRNFVFD